MKGLALTPTEQAAHCLQRIEKCLTTSCSLHSAKQFNEYLYWMYLNGGPDAVANWCFKKLINQGDGIDEVKFYRIEAFIKKYSAWAVADAAVQAKELEMKDVINAHKRADNMNAIQKRAISERDQREHPHAAIKRRLEATLNGKQALVPVKIEPVKSAPEKSRAAGLTLINWNSSGSESMPETSYNGHHYSLEAEATAVINEVQEAEAPKPHRRRRSSAEVAATGTVALKINGMDMEGSAADVAAVLKAYSV